MSIFSTIVSKILNRGASALPSASASTTPTASSGTSAAPNNSNINVPEILSNLAQKQGSASNWQTSIVDLLKLVGMDSSLDARRQLAKELNYDGDMNDSAAMNVWLSKQVMQKLAENGGKLPASMQR